MKLRVRAEELQPGDVLLTGEIVIAKYRGKLTPPTKISLALQKGEAIRVVDWGRWRFCEISRGSVIASQQPQLMEEVKK